MPWYSYLAAFFAGAVLANVVPHFVHGISGNRFPTPFSHPPGKGLSSPTVNVAWSLFNLAVGFLLTRASHITGELNAPLILFFLGIAAISLMASYNFAHKHAA